MDTSKDWYIEFPTPYQRIPTPVTFKQASKTAKKVEFTAGGYQFALELVEGGKYLTGTYTVLEPKVTDNIYFEVKEGGNRLEGHPESSCIYQTWIMTSRESQTKA